MKKRLLSLVMAVAMLFGSAAMLPESVLNECTGITTSAASTATSGKCGENVSWTLEDGVLTITGSGKMTNYNYDSPQFSRLDNKINNIIIDQGVTSIGDYAFCECSSLKSITIPNSVTSIGDSAFGRCYNLTSVTIPNSVTSIGDSAFWCCTSLSSISMPSNVTSIGNGAFRGCEKLTSIIIPSTVTSIGNYAFYGCESLTSVTIPSSVTSIGNGAFYGCECITSVTIPSSVTSIGIYVFYECKSLTSVTIPSSVTSIGSEAFRGCEKLTSINIPSTVTSIGNGAFYECKSLTSITIPSSVTSIGSEAFRWCTTLTSITIPSSVTSIGSYAFFGTEWLENQQNKNPLVVVNGILVDGRTCNGSATIPSSVTSIGNYAFSSCTSLTSVTIPSSVTSIGAFAFENCTNLTSINIPSSVTSIGAGAFGITKWLENRRAENPIVVVNGILIDGQKCSGNVTITKNVTSINEGAFAGSELISINIPNTVLSIGDGAFERCNNLTQIVIPNSVITIGDTIFGWCYNLKSITIGKNVTNIAEHAIGYRLRNKDGIYLKHSDVKIWCYKGTLGEQYAINNGFDYEIISEEPISITNCTINLSSSSYTYDGKAKTPSVTVKDGTSTLKSGTDYNVSYKNNINAGTATVTVTGNGNYSGSVSKTFKIAAADLSSATINGVNSSYTYTGKAITPAVTVALNGKSLTKDTDYTVSYKNNINVGTATITVTGKGNYIGSVSKTFAIVAAKTSISNATISGVNSSYTYTGKEITPTVTVKLNSKTLTNGTDYSVAYKNNINAGTATITVTGKGNYTGSVSKTFTIVAGTTPSSSFVWGKDNWSYNNSSYSGYFSSGTYRSQINNTYQNKLKSNLTNSEYQVIFVGSWYSDAWLDDIWGGSCYGMSSTTFLAQKGLLPYSSYGSGATKLHDLTWPTKSSNISSLVTYYQMLQVKDVIQQQYRTIPSRSNSTNINSIINLLKTNPTVLIGFQKSGWGGHAILAYGYEYGSWTYGGVTYQGRIKICDPNSSIKNDESYYIYYNTSTYSWAIPAYYGITSAKGATFNYIGANVNEINQGGYLSGNSSTRSSDYIARIDAAAISNNRSVAKVKNTNGNYVNQNTAPGDIVESYSYVVGGNEKETVGYDLYDADAAYMVSQAEAVNLQLSIKYQDCRLSGGSAAGDSIIFDKKGYVSVKGESAQFNISMTHDIDFPTDWFTVQVKGDNVNDASLEMVNNGWIISADQLENVVVAVNNKDDSAKTKFSTEYKSALIYEINKNTIGIAVDTDNNGTYETKVKTEDLTQTRLAGSGRYETAAKISQAAFDQADTVVLAYGLNYADALAGVSLATKLKAPILLTNTKTLDATTLAEIKRLKAKNVIILGGTGAISDQVKKELENNGLTAERIAGASRFGTATAIAEKLNENPTDVFFVYAFNSADALSVSPIAASKNAPIIYLTTKGDLNADTAAYLAKLKKAGSVKNAYVIGGEGVISNDMMNKAGNALGVTPTRVFGKDRFATCVAVNEQFKDTLNGDMLCVATGMDFPDALAGGVYAAINKAPLFLVNGKLKTPKLTDGQKAYLKAKSAAKITIFGGLGVVPDSHIEDIANNSI